MNINSYNLAYFITSDIIKNNKCNTTNVLLDLLISFLKTHHNLLSLHQEKFDYTTSNGIKIKCQVFLGNLNDIKLPGNILNPYKRNIKRIKLSNKTEAQCNKEDQSPLFNHFESFLNSKESNNFDHIVDNITKVIIVLINHVSLNEKDQQPFLERIRLLTKYLYHKSFTILPLISQIENFTFGTLDQSLSTKSEPNLAKPISILIYYGYFLNNSSAQNLSKLALSSLYGNITKLSLKSDPNQASTTGNNCACHPNDINMLKKNGELHITTSYFSDALLTIQYYNEIISENKLGLIKDFLVYGFVISFNVIAARVNDTSKPNFFTSLNKDKEGNISSLPVCANGYKKTKNLLNESLVVSNNSICNKAKYKSKPCLLKYQNIPKFYLNRCESDNMLHVTIAHSKISRPKQAKIDLAKIVEMEKEYDFSTSNHTFYRISSGLARNFGRGFWAVYLDRPLKISGIFTAKLQS